MIGGLLSEKENDTYCITTTPQFSIMHTVSEVFMWLN